MIMTKQCLDRYVGFQKAPILLNNKCLSLKTKCQLLQKTIQEHNDQFCIIFSEFLDTLRVGMYGVCPWCNKSFSNLKVHVEDVHCPTDTPCPQCGKIFSSKNKMFSHKYRYCPNKIVHP